MGDTYPYKRDGEPDGWRRRPVAAGPKPVPRRRKPRFKSSFKPPEFYRYRCIECGIELECTSPPSRSPTCRERGCGGPLLYLPADEDGRRRWVHEIAHVAGLERERAQARLFARELAEETTR